MLKIVFLKSATISLSPNLLVPKIFFFFLNRVYVGLGLICSFRHPLLMRGDYCILYLFIYLFMAVLGLHFCATAFSGCGKWAPLFIAVRGPLTVMASLVAEHRLQTRRHSSCGAQA